MKCALCGDPVDTEHPIDCAYTFNPKTKRHAWVHIFCLNNELETAKQTPSGKPEFDNKFDEYLHDPRAWY